MRVYVVLAALIACGFLSAAGSARPARSAGAADWIAAHCTAPGGAITIRPGGTFVSGYFGNITAAGLVAARAHPGIVLRWMEWYIGHARGSGSQLDGVPDDERIRADGSVRSRRPPDSTDAYGATFMMLARAAYESGKPQLREFILAHRQDLLRITRSTLATQQPDGLTWARPQYHVKYAIDNEQVERGLLDASVLMRKAFSDARASAEFKRAASRVAHGMQTVLWDPQTQTYRPLVGTRSASDYPVANITKAYPDALAQAMAVVYGTVAPNDPMASSLIHRAGAALLSSPGVTETTTEYRSVAELAQRLVGDHPLPDPFVPPPLCSDAGWYLLAAAPPV